MTFSNNWFGVTAEPFWTRYFIPIFAGKPNLNFLEIGSFEGRSAVWTCKNLLTGPGCRLTCIDTFKGSEEHKARDLSNLAAVFADNVRPYQEQVSVLVGESSTALKGITGKFDFIYVDGSHVAKDVLTDAVLSWPLLKDGGFLVFDDYTWGDGGIGCPRPAIESFGVLFSAGLETVHISTQAVFKRCPPRKSSILRVA
jgi:Methyltransferase domain